MPRASHLISLSRSASAASGPSTASRLGNNSVPYDIGSIIGNFSVLGVITIIQSTTLFVSSLPPSMGPSFIASTSAFVLSAVTGITVNVKVIIIALS